MEIRQLQLFRAVVESGSISEAARRLNLSQPPLSYHIKMLEQELQTTLFERGRRSIQLTEAGKLLYERSAVLLELENTVAREITEAGNAQRFRIGVTPTTVPLLIPALARLNQTEANLRFELYDGTTFHLRELMERQVLDCTLLRTPVNTEGFQSVSLGRESFIAAGAGAGKTDLAALSARPLILYRRYDALIRNAFYEAGLTPQVHGLCDDARTALMMARQGLGVAILPQSITRLAPDMPVQAIDAPALVSEILLIYPKQSRKEALIHHLCRFLLAETEAQP